MLGVPPLDPPMGYNCLLLAEQTLRSKYYCYAQSVGFLVGFSSKMSRSLVKSFMYHALSN